MKLKVILGSLCVLIFGSIALVFLSAPASPFGPYPSPNGYGMLIQAGRQMTPLPMDFDSSQDVQALRGYLGENQDSLALFEQAEGVECMVPPSMLKLTDQMYDDLGTVRGAFRLQFVKARVEELEGNSDQAADTLTTMAVLGKRCDSGALMVHQLVSIAVERQALEALMQLTPNLSAQKRAVILKAIQAELKDQPDVETQIDLLEQRERYAVRLNHGTLLGSFLIWQTSGLETGGSHVRDAMIEIREQRKALMEMLQAAPLQI